MLQPELIVLDEPTSALDRTVQKQVIELLRDIQARYGLSYIFISHDLSVVRALSHTLLVLQNGSIVEYGKAADIFVPPKNAYTQGTSERGALLSEHNYDQLSPYPGGNDRG